MDISTISQSGISNAHISGEGAQMTPMTPTAIGQLFTYSFTKNIPHTALFLAFTFSTLLFLRRVFYSQYRFKLSLLCITSGKQFTQIFLNLRRFCDRMAASAMGPSRRYVLSRVYLMGFSVLDL